MESRLNRYIKGIYTQMDAETLWNALKTDAGQKLASEEMDRVWEDYTGTTTDTQHQQYKAEAWQILKRTRQQEQPFMLRSFLRYAAILFLLIATGFSIYVFLFSTGKDGKEISYLTLRVDNGQQKQLIFTDGTKAILNAGSLLSYPKQFESGKRRIKLDGEAFFQVAKDASKPFIVQTKNANIEVLGTCFNVKAHSEDEFVSVTVESGKVQVNTEEAIMQLLPGEQLFLDKTNREIHRSHENPEYAKAWISGGLYFKKCPIRSVVNELMRRYNCTIEFEGTPPGEYISGGHDNKTLESVLQSIHYATGIKYRKESGKIILYE
jgi:ferric-dicitrate binding protein FerR (iron transport regulator)